MTINYQIYFDSAKNPASYNKKSTNTERQTKLSKIYSRGAFVTGSFSSMVCSSGRFWIAWIYYALHL